MRVASSVVAFGSFLSAVVACSGQDGSKKQADIATSETSEVSAGILCGKFEECTSTALMQNLLGGVAACKQRHAVQMELQGRSGAILANEGQGRACRDALIAAPCKDILAGVPIEACRVPGALPDGVPCVSDGQCASSACFVDETASCGTCGKRVAEGEDCASAKCGDGLECIGKKRCVKPGAEGDSCDLSGDHPCEALLFCGNQKCVKGLSKGAACKLGADATPCDFFKGLFCIPESNDEGKCDDVLVAHAGEACDVVSISPFAYAVCDDADCVDGQCVPRLADGASCTADGRNKCREPAACREGKCAMLDPGLCK